MSPFRLLVGLLCALGLTPAFPSLAAAEDMPMMTVPRTPTMTAQQLQAKMAKKEPLFLLDVREEDEYAQGHIEGATLIPVKSIRASLDKLPKDKPLVLYCRSGRRSGRVVDFLATEGFTNAVSLEGGILAWSAAGAKTTAPAR